MRQFNAPTIVTMGEPSGIGGEIVLKAWLSSHNKLPPFCVIDSPTRLRDIANSLNLNIDISEIKNIEETFSVYHKALPVLPITLPDNPIPGKLNSNNNAAVLLAINRAVNFVLNGQAKAIVTNPVHKNILHKTGFSHPGHTEYLADLAEIDTEPVMMLASKKLLVIPVTRHISLQSAITKLNSDLIIKTAITADEALRQDFGISNPKIAIAALNPHAGEGGIMGDEEKILIEPAIKVLKGMGLSVTGPQPPDTLFHTKARKKYDVVLCMYHDQALIPIKTLDFETAVNVTLGLPFIRTSPDHGTALDIAGMGCASEQSLISALKLASDMANNRRKITKGL
jgi:4-hydroxythreonine-4-phosphate dehydrogenase